MKSARLGLMAGIETVKTAANPQLSYSFFTGQNILPGVPHLGGGVLGHPKLNKALEARLTAEALKSPLGIATFWLGPFLPALYIVSNEARLALIQEAHIGSISDNSAGHLSTLTNNQVMSNFLAFVDINSDRYRIQHHFLARFFHAKTKERMSEIEGASKEFLAQYPEKYGEKPRSLREFITLLVLHTSSEMLGLTDCSLEDLYSGNPSYREAMNRVALYGISGKGRPELEQMLFELFLEVLKKNFNTIDNTPTSINFIKNIFDSMSVDFPSTFEDFYKLPKNTQHDIAMTFVSVAIGGLIHSTVNSLDWALASLLQNKDKLAELKQLMAENQHIDLTNLGVYDKQGTLAKVSEWVLHHVFLYPTFSHEFFYNSDTYTVEFPDKTKQTIPKGMLLIVNYAKCNRLNQEMTSTDSFSKHLDEQFTVARFMMNEQVASFGGSQINKNNHKSRRCPGAKTSLYEQMLIIAELLKSNYSIELAEEPVSCEIDERMHPLCSRVDSGKVVFCSNPQITLNSTSGAVYN